MATASTVQARPPTIADRDEALQDLLDIPREPSPLALPESSQETWLSAKYVITTNRRADGFNEELLGDLRGKK